MTEIQPSDGGPQETTYESRGERDAVRPSEMQQDVVENNQSLAQPSGDGNRDKSGSSEMQVERCEPRGGFDMGWIESRLRARRDNHDSSR